MATSPSPLLGGSAAARARPLVWWNATQLQHVASRVNAAWMQWARDWVLDVPSEAVVRCEHATGSSYSVALSPLGSRHDAAAWIAEMADDVPGIERFLFPSSSLGSGGTRGEMAKTVARGAMAALRDTLKASLLLESDVDSVALPAFDAWSGSLVVSFSGAASDLPMLLLNAPCVDAILSLVPAPAIRRPQAVRGSLTSAVKALSDRRLSIQVELQPCQIDVGSLAGLHPGDILPIPHTLDSPLRVSADGIALCSGFLGKHEGFKAIELARDAAVRVESISAGTTEP
jgi:hypothetical protein